MHVYEVTPGHTCPESFYNQKNTPTLKLLGVKIYVARVLLTPSMKSEVEPFLCNRDFLFLFEIFTKSTKKTKNIINLSFF